METNTRRTVAQAVWHWDKQVSATDETQVRERKAFIQFSVMSIAASLLAIIFKLRCVYLIAFLYLFSFLVLLGGYKFPSLFYAIEKFGKWLARAVGAAMTSILLVPFFYLCFWPGRLILNAMGKDPMQRQWEKDRKSYWTDKRKSEDVSRYTKQY